MVRKIYEMYAKKLEKEIKKVPSHIVIITDKIDEEKFLEFLNWVEKFKISELTLCVKDELKLNLNNKNIKIRVIKDGDVFESGWGNFLLNIILNFDGKKEIVKVFRNLAEKVAKGKIDLEDVDEKMIEQHLAIRSQPDMIIKVGKEIPEFLIWQSIYSELFFVDLDWKNFRYIDFLRMLRDYQRRERRHGR